MNERSLIRAVAAFSLASSTIFAINSTSVGAERATATVSIEGVHYTFPHPGFGDIERAELKPSDPLCYAYEYFYMTIVDRELFINGVLAYKARPGDRVVVSYGAGGDYWKHVRVNGRPAAQQPEKTLPFGKIQCSSFAETIRIIRRPPRQ